MKKLAAFFAAFQVLLWSSPVLAQDMAAPVGGMRTVLTETWVEEWDPASGQWVRVSETQITQAPAQPNAPQAAAEYAAAEYTVRPVQATQISGSARYAQPVQSPAARTMLAQFGPFIVTSPTRAALVGSTDSLSPRQFDAMLMAFPDLAVLDMIEAPGTSNDIANLALGRRIRAAGLATHVPTGGSVRSGAVELFLAGTTRTVEQGAQFAVHSWLDTHGREADDFAADDPTHRLYLDYYVEMGMSERRAQAFYDMTNSVPHQSALWLGADEMEGWIAPERAPDRAPALRSIRAPYLAGLERGFGGMTLARSSSHIAQGAPRIDYGDLGTLLLAAIDDGTTLQTAPLRLALLDSRAAFP